MSLLGVPCKQYYIMIPLSILEYHINIDGVVRLLL